MIQSSKLELQVEIVNYRDGADVTTTLNQFSNNDLFING